MVTIRLSRFGRKNAPFYRVAVVDDRKKTTSSVVEYIGTWNPIKKITDIDQEKVKEWIKKGAQMSASVKKILEK